LFFFANCSKPDICDCFKRAGEIDSIEFEIEKINYLNIYNKFNVYIKHDSINKVILKTNKNLIDLIDISVKDSSLNIIDNNICNFSRSYDLEIDVFLHLSNLNCLYVHGPSNVYSIDTLKYDNVLFRVYKDIGNLDITIVNTYTWLEYWFASGNAKFRGGSVYLDILSHGYAYIDCFDFKSQYIKLNQNTTGDTKIFPITGLTVWFRDIGDVYYKGNPEFIEIKENLHQKELIHVE
jgi:hypothetical protein